MMAAEQTKPVPQPDAALSVAATSDQSKGSIYIPWLALIYAVAIGLRVWRFFSAGLSGDNATTGLMGLAVLQGEFPFFFFGQNWMGGLDAILAAPLYALFGPSALTVNILSPVFSLAIMLCLQPLLRRTLGVWGMLAGLAYLAVPPTTWLFWSGEAQVHYLLGLLLSSLVLLMTHQLWQAPVWKWTGLVLWGLFAGCAVWTNFSSAVVILPCVVFLLVTGRGKLRIWSVPLATLAGIVGGFPLIWFNLTHGMVHANQTSIFGSRYVLPGFQALADNALPLILGVNTTAVGGPPSTNQLFLLLYGLLITVVAAGIYFLFKFSRRQRLPLAFLMLAIFLLNIGIVISSAYGKTLFSPDQRYLLSLYLILPFLVGAVAKWLAQKRAWAAVAMILALALIHASQYSDFQRWGRRLLAIHEGYYFSREAKTRQNLREMREAGFKYVYSNFDNYPMDFLGNGDPVVADYWRHRWLTSSLKVDTANDPGLLEMPKGSLDILGLKHNTWQGKISHAFVQPAGAAVLLPRDRWSAKAGGQDLGQVLGDADLTTGFSTKGKATDGASLTIDLGRSQEVGGLALIPAEFREVPRGLKVELGGPDGQFVTIRQGRGYWGPFYMSGPHPFLKARNSRVESYFPPQKTRYIRLTHLDDSNHPWSIQEVLMFGPGPRAASASWSQSADQVFAILQSSGVKKIYGDAWISAKVVKHFGGRISAVTGNAAINNFGTTIPPLSEPLVLHPEKGSALIINTRTAAYVAEQLASYGIIYENHPAGRFVVFTMQGQARGAPVAVKKMTSATDQGGAAEQCPVWRTVDGHVTSLGWLELDNPRFKAQPIPEVKCQVKTKDGPWIAAKLVKAGPVVFSGQVLLAYTGRKDLYRLTPPMRAEFVRLCTGHHRAGNMLQDLEIGLRRP